MPVEPPTHPTRGGRVMRVTFLAVAGLSIGATAWPSSGTSVEVQRKPVAAVSVTLPSPSLEEGQTGQATATPIDANGAPLPDRPVEWESSNSAIASVNASGMISALTLGTATIVATSEGAR